MTAAVGRAFTGDASGATDTAPRKSGAEMTYFTYQHRRGTRGEEVYAGPTLLGRVVVRSDWRARLRLGAAPVDVYLALPLDGPPLPRTFATRHDAAEALHDLTVPVPLSEEVHQLND